jgi:hypothetical protein
MTYAEKPRQEMRSVAGVALPAILFSIAGIAVMFDGFGYHVFGQIIFWIALGALLLGMSVAYLTRHPPDVQD